MQQTTHDGVTLGTGLAGLRAAAEVCICIPDAQKGTGAVMRPTQPRPARTSLDCLTVVKP